MCTRVERIGEREREKRVNLYIAYMYVFTVKTLNSGHIGGRTLVHCREVVPILEVD